MSLFDFARAKLRELTDRLPYAPAPVVHSAVVVVAVLVLVVSCS